MPYSLYKKLGGTNEELIKTNVMISDIGGGEPIPFKGVKSMELSIGSKTLATKFFVVEVQGSYNLILGCNWIHANWCVPSSLHQLLIRWVDDEVEIVPADSSAHVAIAVVVAEPPEITRLQRCSSSTRH